MSVLNIDLGIQKRINEMRGGKVLLLFFKILLWLEMLVLALFVMNIIFTYIGEGVFQVINPIVFHADVWEILLRTSTFKSMLGLGMPIAITAIGGAFNERSGVINIGLEGIMVWGAWAAVYFTHETGNPWMGALGAILFGLLVGLLHAIFTITFKAEQIVTGVAINLLALGMTNVLTIVIWNQQYSPIVKKIPVVKIFEIPLLGPILEFLSFSHYFDKGTFFNNHLDFIAALNNHNGLIWIGLLIIPLAHILLFKTTIGLRIRVIGEYPQAAATAGIPVRKYQYFAVILSGTLAGFGGAILSIGLTSQFIENIVGGRGFIALAAMIFGKWTIFGSVLGAMIFGYFFSLQIKLDIGLPNYFVVPIPFIQMIPYLVTILALTGFIGDARPPKNIGKPYDPTES